MSVLKTRLITHTKLIVPFFPFVHPNRRLTLERSAHRGEYGPKQRRRPAWYAISNEARSVRLGSRQERVLGRFRTRLGRDGTVAETEGYARSYLG